MFELFYALLTILVDPGVLSSIFVSVGDKLCLSPNFTLFVLYFMGEEDSSEPNTEL